MERMFSQKFFDMFGSKCIELSQKTDEEIKKELPYLAKEFRDALITLGARKRRLKKEKGEEKSPKGKGKK